ncbi:MAG: glycoside hydrolase family 20 zincin-like fold domain-containing protein [Oligosphaeraceae bacterium]
MMKKKTMTRRSPLLVLLLALAFSLQAQNLIPNPQFKEGTDQNGVPRGWYHDTPEYVKYQYGVVEEEEGRSSFRIERLAPGDGLCRISANVNVRPGTDYLLTLDVKDPGNSAELYLYDYSTDGKYETRIFPVPRNQAQWQTLSFFWSSREDTARIKLSLVAGKATGAVSYGNLSLVCVDEPAQLNLPVLRQVPGPEAGEGDAAWRRAYATTPYLPIGKDGSRPVTALTTARLGYAQGELHILVHAREPRPQDRILGKETLWQNDTLELFLRDPVTNMTYHVGVTPTGEQGTEVVNQERVAGFAKDWYSQDTTVAAMADVQPLAFRSHVQETPEGWWVHFAIPLAQQNLESRGDLALLLARGRKTSAGEEYSSWGRTTGDFFKDSQGFATVTLPVVATPPHASAEPLAPPPAGLPEALVVPAPQQAAFQESALSFAAPLAIHATQEKGFLAARQMMLTQFHQEPRRVETAAEAQVILTVQEDWSEPELANLESWQLREAYRLETTEEGQVRILAGSHRGLVNGMATLCQLLAPREDGALACRHARILDWPDLEYRGWHCLSPSTDAEVPLTLQFIDTLASLKFNWFSIQFDGRFAYERHPELSNWNATSKESHRAIAARLELYDIQVIPMTQLLSHFRHFLRKPELRRFAEIPNPEKETPFSYWNYCPRHPEIHDLVFDMIDEHLECYPNAKWYHVGMDEATFEPFGVCERCRDTSGGELYAEEVQRLHDYVVGVKGLRMAMWCDQLEVQRNGGVKPYNTAEALPLIPRDVVIFDWHYRETPENPTVKFFMDEGFQVIACGWYFPENVVPLAEEAHRQKALGYGGTSWVFMKDIRLRSHLMTSVVLGAERSWNAHGPALAQLPYVPQELFVKLHDGRDQEPPRKFLPLDLGDACNMTLAGDSRQSWMGLGPESDCSSLPTGLQWLENIPFQISTKKLGAVATRDESQEMQRYPKAVKGIPVGIAARELVFLQTATRPRFVVRTQGNDPEKPTALGSYVIHYQDGETLRIPLNWEENITHWNAQMPSAFGLPLWQGATPEGARIALEGLRWKNPRPDVPVVSVDLESLEGKSAPVLLAITAILE